jgi:hypothetical protein
MSDIPDNEPTEEDVKMLVFMREFAVLLDRYGLTQADDDSEVPHERAAHVMISEVHDWYRSGRLDVGGDSFTGYCELIQEANYEVDDIEDEYSADS